MNMFIKLTIICNLIALIKCGQICYDEYGCFTDEYPFGGSHVRPLSILPSKPSKINTKFTLYNRADRKNEKNMTLSNIGSNFNSSIPTKFITHGFFDFTFGWLKNMKDGFLDIDNFNIILVDWTGGNGLPYTLATANTQIVGAEIARLAQSIMDKTDTPANSFHCIGHSLGAHICGYAGKRIKGFGRISGLDPAGPYFEKGPAVIRLDKTDADFVDIIHTNAKKLVGDTTSIGMKTPIGHIDFYPNGGEVQPGCWLTDGNIAPHCSHMGVTILYTDSLKNKDKCPLTAYPCSSTGDYYNGKCLKCGSNGCNRMGYYASPDKDLNSLYLDTQSLYAKNRCKFNYHVNLLSDDFKNKEAKGKFEIYLETDMETSETTLLENGYMNWKSNSVNDRLISFNKRLNGGEIKKAFITYTENWDLLGYYESKWSFKKVIIYSAEFKNTFTLCPIESFMGISKTVEYELC